MTTSTPSTPASPVADLRVDALPHGHRWQLRLLGDVVLSTATGQPQRLPGRAATALLARLALAPGRAQPREELIELLWPGVALNVGRNRLRQVLSTLKALLDTPAAPGGAGTEVLRADRQSLRLACADLHCDAVAFEAAMRAGQHAQAAVLYRGALLPGFYDEWILEERNRLATLAETAAPAGATTAAALAGTAAPPPPQPAPVAPPAALNLPHYLTALHGADAMGARLRAGVGVHRLVTLLGPGGAGKTRLAVEVAQSLAGASGWGLAGVQGDAAAPRFDLVAFVPLVACQGPEALLAALLVALRLEPRAQPPLQQLAGVLAHRHSLLVLDNCEQLVDSSAGLVADLLAQCPGLHLLATSRRVLGLDGEHTLALPPLPLPPDDVAAPDGSAAALNPAVALFVDRARAVRPAFRLDAHNRAAVVGLVRRLQGMPLAIELAAARLRSLGPAALLALLPPVGALPTADAPGLQWLARSGPRAGGDARHASMLAVVQWSWRLLSPAAQALLPRLAVFAGSFSLAAAQALGDGPPVAGAPAGTPTTPLATALAIDELVAQSMLRVELSAGAEGGEPRYLLFELIREFAASRLSDAVAAQMRSRHCRWLAGWFAALPLGTPLQQVRPEVPNLAAALLGAEADGEPADAAALLQAAQLALSAISLPPLVLAALDRCADLLADPVQRAVTRAMLARHHLVAGQGADAGRLADQALAGLPPPAHAHARALVLTRAAHVRWRLHRDVAARAWLDEALALTAPLGLPALQASIVTNLGALVRSRSPAEGITLQRRAIALWQAAGDNHGVSVGRCNLAMALITHRAGCAEALELLQQVLADTRAVDDALQHALACNLRGEAWSRLGEWHAAARAYRDCTAAAWAAAEPWPLLYGLWNLPRPLAHAQQPQQAARLMGFAEQHAAAAGPLTAADRHDLRRLQRLCAVQAGADAVARWRAEGQALSLPLAVRLALHGA